MVVYGFHDKVLEYDLEIARRLGATVLEILPDWRSFPDPSALRTQVEARGLRVHSAHGCWGARAIQAERVDLGATDASTHIGSVDDLRRCLDWTGAAGGRCLVVHPGGLSSPETAAERRDALARGLCALAEHARGSGVLVCVENMPPGVHPGSRMADLAALLAELDQPGVALAIDTGHAHMNSTAAQETHAAGARLRTTHVHDNNGRHDVHLPPGEGTIDWPAWSAALDAIAYDGPVMLECIRHLRESPSSLTPALLALLDQLATPAAP
jgi:sugar phosphate isomerase/epimerase